MIRIIKIVTIAAVTAYFGMMSAAEAAIEAKVVRVVNINTAGMSELVQLPGIGLYKANEIIEYRKIHPFNDTSELLRVKGISPRLFRLLAHQVTFYELSHLKI